MSCITVPRSAAILALLAGNAAAEGALPPFTHDEAFATVLRIAQAWPADLADIKDIYAGGRDIPWLDFGVQPTRPVTEDPWSATLFEMEVEQGFRIDCARVGPTRLATLRELETMIDSGMPSDDPVWIETFAALQPPPNLTERYAIMSYWTDVPAYAVAVQHCNLMLPVPPGEIDPLPTVLSDAFDTIRPGLLSHRASTLTDFDRAFPPMSIAIGWRGAGITGDVRLQWSLLFTTEGLDDPTSPRLLDLSVTSWLAPMGS